MHKKMDIVRLTEKHSQFLNIQHTRNDAPEEFVKLLEAFSSLLVLFVFLVLVVRGELVVAVLVLAAFVLVVVLELPLRVFGRRLAGLLDLELDVLGHIDSHVGVGTYVHSKRIVT